jgi:hypothetical protein
MWVPRRRRHVQQQKVSAVLPPPRPSPPPFPPAPPPLTPTPPTLAVKPRASLSLAVSRTLPPVRSPWRMSLEWRYCIAAAISCRVCGECECECVVSVWGGRRTDADWCVCECVVSVCVGQAD